MRKLLFLYLSLHIWSFLVHSSWGESSEETTREYIAKFQRAFNSTTPPTSEPRPVIKDPPKPFTCDTTKPEWYTPATDVHKLTPWDISIIGAMGDSVTAAFGADATTIIGDIIEYRWLSWSIGGHQSIESVSTLPNIIKQYNPDLRGFSVFLNSNLNVARSGAKSDAMLSQAEKLVQDMANKHNGDGSLDEKWKVITLWIGGNDLCVACDQGGKTPQELAVDYAFKVEAGLTYLSKYVKRAYVNLVDMIDITQLKLLNGFWCPILHPRVCRCTVGDDDAALVAETVKQYNIELKNMLEKNNYYNRDDFTVALQPFFSDTEVPMKDGHGDMDYFAPDCFHFSVKGHGIGALYLWNNMLEKPGEKTDYIDWSDLQDYICISEENPYFTSDVQLEQLGKSNLAGGLDSHYSVPALVGTVLAVVLIAVMVIGIAAVVIRKRRKESRANIEKVQLISVKL